MSPKLQPRSAAVGIVLLSVLLAPFLLGLIPTTRFVREQIDIKVKSSYITVTGRYVYKNPMPFPVVQGLSIPFHVDRYQAPPIFLQASELSPRSRDIALRYILGRHRFDMKFRPLEEKTVKISYRQETPLRNARYILKTTQPWKLPLDEGIYRIQLNGAALVETNYPMVSADNDICTFTRKKFMPSEDWEFSWKN